MFAVDGQCPDAEEPFGAGSGFSRTTQFQSHLQAFEFGEEQAGVYLLILADRNTHE